MGRPPPEGPAPTTEPVSGLAKVSPVNAPGTDGRAARPTRARWRLGVVAAAALPLLLGGCQVPTFWGYRGNSTQGQDAFKLYAGTFIASIVIFVIVFGMMMWAIVAYRRRGDEIPRQFQYHVPLEITYTVIPLIIVLILFGFTFATENNVNALAPNPAVKIKVIAFQWGWTFAYGNEHLIMTGETTGDPDPVGINGAPCAPVEDCYGPALVLPLGQDTRITLVSNDTIHGFYVPVFNFSRYAQPGVINHFDITPTATGVFRAQCTQLCGLYHSLMFFHVVVLPRDQYRAWVATEQAHGGTFSAGSDSNLGPTPQIPGIPQVPGTGTTGSTSSTPPSAAGASSSSTASAKAAA
jgi:cytochrome c oxidase subunit II